MKKRFTAFGILLCMLVNCCLSAVSGTQVGKNEYGHQITYEPITQLYTGGEPVTFFDAGITKWAGLSDKITRSEAESIMLDEYMEPGRYKLHFLWKSGTGEKALDGVPNDFTSDSMVLQISNDLKYSNSYYGVVTIQRDNNNKYKVVPYKSETEFQNAQSRENDFDKNLLLSFRGDISNDRANKKFYRLFGKDKDVNINHILTYRGDDLTIHEKDDGTVEILMDGKITTVGANTTVRNGTAAFRLNSGTEYIIPEYDSSGKVVENGELSGNKDFIELKWDNAFDILTTVGGLLIDLKYGVLGKIQNDDNEKIKSDIISFGGSLDLGFMTPGGTAAVRQNTAVGARWTTKVNEIEYDDMDDGYPLVLTLTKTREHSSHRSRKKILNRQTTMRTALRRMMQYMMYFTAAKTRDISALTWMRI